MREIEKRTNKGYEIECYYPKVNGRYTEKSGNTSHVIQCDNVGEVAQWFARRSWGRPTEDSNECCPTVWYNGAKWNFNETDVIKDSFYYKGFVIMQNPYKYEALDFKDAWHVFIAAKPNEEGMTYVRSCESYAECIERIDNQTI